MFRYETENVSNYFIFTLALYLNQKNIVEASKANYKIPRSSRKSLILCFLILVNFKHFYKYNINIFASVFLR